MAARFPSLPRNLSPINVEVYAFGQGRGVSAPRWDRCRCCHAWQAGIGWFSNLISLWDVDLTMGGSEDEVYVLPDGSSLGKLRRLGKVNSCRSWLRGSTKPNMLMTLCLALL